MLKDRIIILKVQKYSDAHLIVTGINPQGAKFSALAPAALKSRKRFGGGVLEPTHFVEVQYEKPQSEDRLPILKDALLLDSFEKLRTDYDKLTLSFYFLRVIESTIQEEPVDSESSFSLLGHALKALENATDLKSFKKHFEMKFLYAHGLLAPEAEILVFLRKKLSENVEIPSSFTSKEAYIKMHQVFREYVGPISGEFQFET